jgi:hypothetical protein
MILPGVIIGVSLSIFATEVNRYAILIVAALVLIPCMFFSTILSIDIVGQQLVLKMIAFFRERTVTFDIRDVELQLFHIPGERRRRHAYYCMYVVRGQHRLHEIRHNLAELTAFIEQFNRKKAGI